MMFVSKTICTIFVLLNLFLTITHAIKVSKNLELSEPRELLETEVKPPAKTKVHECEDLKCLKEKKKVAEKELKDIEEKMKALEEEQKKKAELEKKLKTKALRDAAAKKRKADFEKAVKKLKDAKAKVTLALKDAGKVIADFAAKGVETMKELAKKSKKSFFGAFKKMKEKTESALHVVSDAAHSVVDTAEEIANDIKHTITKAMHKTIDTAIKGSKFAKKLAAEAKTKITHTLEVMGGYIAKGLQAFIDAGKKLIDSLTNEIKALDTAIKNIKAKRAAAKGVEKAKLDAELKEKEDEKRLNELALKVAQDTYKRVKKCLIACKGNAKKEAKCE